MTESYDLVIVGGGLIGNSLVCMLADLNWRIAVIENKDISNESLPRDNRSIVLTYTSYQILNALGLWQELATQAYPIKKIHVSHVGNFGAARFTPEQIGVPLFGYVVPAGLLTQILQQAMLNLAANKQIDLICPAEVQNINFSDINEIILEQQKQQHILNAQLIVAADGTRSKIRELAQIKTTTFDYKQTAIISTVEISQDHQATAYERLTNSGPFAMLPREQNQCGLVWTVNSRDVNELRSCTESELITKLQQTFGYRLGKIKSLNERSFYPLHLMQAQQQIRPGLILLGNAAHTLHPLAGQGFNLGLRDAAALAEVLVEAKNARQSLGNISILESYEKWRRQDQKNIIRFTDRSVRLFSQEFLPLKSAGLVAIELVPFLKRKLTRQLLGFGGRTAKLACAVPLMDK